MRAASPSGWYRRAIQRLPDSLPERPPIPGACSPGDSPDFAEAREVQRSVRTIGYVEPAVNLGFENLDLHRLNPVIAGWRELDAAELAGVDAAEKQVVFELRQAVASVERQSSWADADRSRFPERIDEAGIGGHAFHDRVAVVAFAPYKI